MMFKKIDLGVARSDDGIEIAVTGRYEARATLPDGRVYSVGLYGDNNTRTILGGELKQLGENDTQLRVKNEEKISILEYFRLGISVLTKKQVEID